MKETIDLLGKILTNVLTALYEPFEYSNAIVHAFQKFKVLPQLSVNGIETKVLK